MTDSETPVTNENIGRALTEFAMRFTTAMMESRLMGPTEANEMLEGIARALTTGKLTPGVTERYQAERDKLRSIIGSHPQPD
jgi:hypothetical protein